MERLTHYDDDIFVVMNECQNCNPGNNNEACGLCEHQDSANSRLAAYEDTGLAPEEIAYLRAQLTQVTAERDAAVTDLQAFVENPCAVCKHVQDQRYCYTNCQNHDRENYRAWEWRGKESDNANG